ncbi:MAG: ATP-binding cassette domain-containing protein [Pseudomonadota bacterium]
MMSDTKNNATDPMVRFDKVTKRYGDLTVLDALDLDVAQNKMVSIIGLPGSGKTTLLRLLMTLEDITEGVIWVDGEPLTRMHRRGHPVKANRRHLRAQRSDIGMEFQHFNLFLRRTALENCIEGPAHVLGMSTEEAGARAADLLDEVTSALDQEVIGEVLAVIRQLHHDHDLTMLMVTHQMGFAKEISDRVCVFHSLRIEEQDTPEQLLGDPQSRTHQVLSAVLEAG